MQTEIKLSYKELQQAMGLKEHPDKFGGPFYPLSSIQKAFQAQQTNVRYDLFAADLYDLLEDIVGETWLDAYEAVLDVMDQAIEDGVIANTWEFEAPAGPDGILPSARVRWSALDGIRYEAEMGPGGISIKARDTVRP